MSRCLVTYYISSLACLALLLSPVATADDWPGWLGPFHNGSSSEKVFGKGKPKLHVAWERKLGRAYSQVSIVDGKAITMYGDGESDWLLAVDAGNGEDLWQYRIDDMFPKVGGAHGGQHASQMYSKNLTTFLDHLLDEGKLVIDREDEITKGTLVSFDGEVVNEMVRSRLEANG